MFNLLQGEIGRKTLEIMGNNSNDIEKLISSVEQEKELIENFLQLEKSKEQITWMMRYENKTIGAAWIDLVEKHGVKAPSVHLMIADESLRRHGLGKASLNAMIRYISENLDTGYIHSRHLAKNEPVKKLIDSFGFKKDGKPYFEDGLEWQNIRLKTNKDSCDPTTVSV